MIATREIGAPYGAIEQDIANHGKTSLRLVKDNMAGRMSRTVKNLELQNANLDDIPVFQPAIGREVRGRNTGALSLSGKLINPEGIFAMWPFDQDSQSISELFYAAGMIDMTMGHQNFLYRRFDLLRRRHNTLQFATRIHHSGLIRLLTDQQRDRKSTRLNSSHV